MFRSVKKMKVYCEYAKREVDFESLQLPRHREAHGVVCVLGADRSCRGEIGCALYESFWFDGSIADEEQQKILKEAHRKEEWTEKCVEWLNKRKRRRTR